jgi:hypothetical protein
MTIDEGIEEMRAIAFSDVLEVLRWRTGPEGQQLMVLDSDQIPDDVARAIQEVWTEAQGRIRVRFHNKLADWKASRNTSLLMLGRAQRSGRQPLPASY